MSIDTSRSEPRPGTTILLVEDHKDTREAMLVVLTYSGYVVDTAENVESAVKVLSLRSFDVLISDIGLPDGTGHDLMRRLSNAGIFPKAIALSGFGQADDIKKSSEVGFLHHVVKPVNLDVLNGLINQVLDS